MRPWLFDAAREGGGHVDAMIQIEGLRKTFRTPFRQRRVEAVKALSFDVRSGETFGFLGPNGAGKTTTIKVLTGLVKPTGGSVRVMGGSPQDISVRARIGYLPEQPYFYDYLKPTEILDYFGRLFGIPAAERRRRIDRLLDQVGLSYARDRTLRKFSKGMLQRIGIAQALLNDPELVILDEPMSGLDPIGRKEVVDIITSLRERGRTVFFSSHILADVERLADRVVILDRGTLKAAGTLPELLAGGRDEREVTIAGPLPDVVAAALGDSARIERSGTTSTRIVIEAAALDGLLRALLDAEVTIRSVGDHRMTLEDLVVSLAGGGDFQTAKRA